MALVITRKNRQKIYIGDDIEIEIRAIRTNTVSIAVTAPRELRIHRCDGKGDKINDGSK